MSFRRIQPSAASDAAGKEIAGVVDSNAPTVYEIADLPVERASRIRQPSSSEFGAPISPDAVVGVLVPST